MSSNSNECAICLRKLKAGKGQAIYTAECFHSFHFNCLSNNVKQGKLHCPVCRHKLNSVPFQAPGVVNHQVLPLTSSDDDLSSSDDEPVRFSDDEPLPSTTPISLSSGPQSVAIKTYTEYTAIAAAESRPRFPVLVNIRAPPLCGQGRTPIDLVAVLDVSGSMSGQKINLLKRAVKFVIENMGPSDRLSIVSFSTSAKRILPLKRMSVDGRECATRAVESLRDDGGTNIVEGLKKGVKVLEDRQARNPVSSIILLSDGQDNYITDASVFVNRMPAALRSRNIPVHAFGLGHDHDSNIMNAISNSSGGTFSFIESFGMVQDAFAMCIGGLLSVVAQELRLTVRSASPGVQIVSIPSGRHGCTISDECQQGVVDVGSMYAEEEKQFLVYLLVPAYSESGNGQGASKTPLLDVSCRYKDLASDESNQVQGERVEILRPGAWSSADESVCLEVDRERNRISAAEGIAEAQAMAERGNFVAAQATLAQRRQTILASEAAQAGDGLSNWLEHELSETRDRMRNRSSYAETGRAYALAGLSAHTAQRATTRGDMTCEMLAAGADNDDDVYALLDEADAAGAAPGARYGNRGSGARNQYLSKGFGGQGFRDGGRPGRGGASAGRDREGAAGASFRDSDGARRAVGYETAAMRSMVIKSKQQNPDSSRRKRKSEL